MTAAQWIGLALKVSLSVIVLCIGLNTRSGDLLWLLRRPGLLARSLLAMNVLLPAIAAALAFGVGLKPPVAVALVALAVSPVPPVLPGKQVRAGGRESYAVALLACSALLAVVLVPATVALLDLLSVHTLHVPPSTVAGIVATTVLAPLLAGVALRALIPTLAARVARPLSLGATVLLLVAFLPVVVKMWPSLMTLVGDFTLAAIVILVVLGLLIGHLLGGPDPGDRTVLALSTATRHPGVAVAVARAATPAEPAVVAAVLLAFLVGAVAPAPYVKWRKRVPAAAEAS
jgi:BASS family bile acid:Na+ symporter